VSYSIRTFAKVFTARTQSVTPLARVLHYRGRLRLLSDDDCRLSRRHRLHCGRLHRVQSSGRRLLVADVSFHHHSLHSISHKQWRNKVAVGPRASIPKGPPLPPKKLKKQRRANFGPPTALGPRALHALHALLLRHWPQTSNQSCRHAYPTSTAHFITL